MTTTVAPRARPALATLTSRAHPGLELVLFPPRTGAAPSAEMRARLDAEWVVRYDLRAARGAFIVAALHVEPAAGVDQPPPRGLTARSLRRVRLGDHARFIAEILEAQRRLPQRERSAAAMFFRAAGFGAVFDVPPSLPRHSQSGARRPGRPPLDMEVYLRAVRAYTEAIKRGSRRPIIDAAQALGETRERMRDLLHRARHPRHGLLAGETLTAKARALLRDMPDAAPRRSQPRRVRR